MGTSTDAILFYGIHGDEGEWEGISIESWESVLAEKRGVVDPETPYKTEEEKRIQSEYWDRKREICEAEPCAVGIHCSYECEMPYAYVKDSRIEASRGYPEAVSSLTVNPKWDANLKAFCDLIEIPWSQPQWWLVSFWG